MIQVTDFEGIKQASTKCVHCGHCVTVCPSLTAATLDLGRVAQGLWNARIVPNAAAVLGKAAGLTQAVRGCFMCRRCVEECPSEVDVIRLMLAGREVYQAAGAIDRSAWSSVQVDQEWHIFTAYRAIYGIGYADLIRHKTTEGTAADADCKVAFFPGCSLAAYNPELTRTVFEAIEELGGKATLIDYCCGSPLKSAGFAERATALRQGIVAEIEASGATQVLCCCPGCRNILEQAAREVGSSLKCVMLPGWLLEHGFEPVQAPEGVRIFQSCQDRCAYMAQPGATAVDDIRRLLAGAQDAPVLCDGCCGAGGAVSAFAPDQQAAQVQGVLASCEAGETLVSTCPTCTYTFAFQLMQQPADVRNKNYLELVFGHDFDWDTVFARLQGMWSGEYKDWLAATLS